MKVNREGFPNLDETEECENRQAETEQPLESNNSGSVCFSSKLNENFCLLLSLVTSGNKLSVQTRPGSTKLICFEPVLIFIR